MNILPVIIFVLFFPLFGYITILVSKSFTLLTLLGFSILFFCGGMVYDDM